MRTIHDLLFPALCGLVLASGPAEALGPAAPLAQERESSADSDTQPRKRILHLVGGTTLRAKTRKTDTGWEYKRKGQWTPLAAGAVARAVPEREALKAIEQARASLADLTPNSRATLAESMFSMGLLEEALAELDGVLRTDPSHARTLRALADNAHRFGLPAVGPGEEAFKEIFAWAAGTSQSGRELALLKLRTAEDQAALRAAFTSDLYANTGARRAFAAQGLGRLFPGEEVRPLLQRSVLDAAEPVRLAAAHALGAAGEPGLVVPIVRALERSASPKVRMNAAQSLGNMGYPAAVQPLIARLATLQQTPAKHSVPHSNIFIGRQFAFIQDFDVEVAQFQAVADPQINVLVEGQVTDAGVIGVKHARFAGEVYNVKRALGGLTGADPGDKTRDWLAWWDDNSADWESAKHSSATGTAAVR